MQRKISIVFIALALICFMPKSYAQKGKSEIALGYGYYSMYSLANGAPLNVSSGSPVITYRYYVTRNVTLGMGVGYENIGGAGLLTGSLLTICPELTFSYFDTRKAPIRVRCYGAVSLGVTIFTDGNIPPDQTDESGLKPWGFQATPFGIRIGRQVAAFAEVGVGYKGLIHGGMDIRFPRLMKVRQPMTE